MANIETKKGLISIVIPVWNHQLMLKEALRSIALQTYKHYEIIIVDDGSDEPVIVPEVGLDPAVPVTLIRQEHAGAPAARNLGMKEAMGEYIIFWDADVIGEPQLLEKMLHVLIEYPEAAFAYSSFRFGVKKMKSQEYDADTMRDHNYIHTTSLIRRSDMLAWDERLERFQDWDVWLSLLKKGKVGVWIPQYLFHVVPRRYGISKWVPKFAYKRPWRWLPWFYFKVMDYERAQAIIDAKHRPHMVRQEEEKKEEEK